MNVTTSKSISTLHKLSEKWSYAEIGHSSAEIRQFEDCWKLCWAENVERLANSWTISYFWTNRWTISIRSERLLSGRLEIRIWVLKWYNYPLNDYENVGTIMESSSAHCSYFGHRFFIRTPIWVNQSLKNPGNRDLQFLCCNFLQIMQLWGRYELWKADVSYGNIYKPRFVSLPLYRSKY